MSQFPDENGQLAGLLRAIPAPEPSSDFLPGAHRRYLEALEARFRREVSSLSPFPATLRASERFS